MSQPIRLVVEGDPQGKQRPRFNGKTGRVYTPPATKLAETKLRTVWQAAGSPRLAEGAVGVRMTMVFGRPANHTKKDGSLGKAGLRSPRPYRKPDIDNCVKLLDALNGLAFQDDAMITHLEATKRWVTVDEQPHTQYLLWTL